MIKVLFVCHGNICRSPMAEFMFKDMVKKRGEEDKFLIQSAATSTEEIGNSVYYPAAKKLAQMGIDSSGKTAVQIKKSDYGKYDFIIGMESINVRNIQRITGHNDSKICRLLDFSDRPRDIADPWYTGNFDITYDDISEGLNGFLKYIDNKML